MIDLASTWVMKVIGAISGTIMAQLYMKPSGIIDAVIRAVFTILSGVFFAEWIMALLSFDSILAASVFVALFSWPIMGFVVSTLRKLDVESILKIITTIKK